MNLNLKIFDTQILPSTGKLVVGCVDSNLDHLTEKEIRELILNTELFLYLHDKFVQRIHPKDVQTSSSIIDKKNIDILIDDYIPNHTGIINGYLKNNIPV